MRKIFVFCVVIIFAILHPLLGVSQSQKVKMRFMDAFEQGKINKSFRLGKKIAKANLPQFEDSWQKAMMFDEQNLLDSASIYYEASKMLYETWKLYLSDEEFGVSRDSIKSKYFRAMNGSNMVLKSSKSIFLLAMFENMDGRFEKALVDINTALEMDPGNFEYLYYRGWIYKNLELYDSAYNDYSECIRQKEKYHEAYLNRGFISMTKGDYELAIADFEKLISIKKCEIWTRSYAYNNMGFTYFKMNYIDVAESYINTSINIFPLNAYAYKNLAIVQLAKGEKKKACKSLKMAIKTKYKITYDDEVDQLWECNCK